MRLACEPLLGAARQVEREAPRKRTHTAQVADDAALVYVLIGAPREFALGSGSVSVDGDLDGGQAVPLIAPRRPDCDPDLDQLSALMLEKVTPRPRATSSPAIVGERES